MKKKNTERHGDDNKIIYLYYCALVPNLIDIFNVIDGQKSNKCRYFLNLPSLSPA